MFSFKLCFGQVETRFPWVKRMKTEPWGPGEGPGRPRQPHKVAQGTQKAPKGFQWEPRSSFQRMHPEAAPGMHPLGCPTGSPRGPGGKPLDTQFGLDTQYVQDCLAPPDGQRFPGHMPSSYLGRCSPHIVPYSYRACPAHT